MEKNMVVRKDVFVKRDMELYHKLQAELETLVEKMIGAYGVEDSTDLDMVQSDIEAIAEDMLSEYEDMCMEEEEPYCEDPMVELGLKEKDFL